MSEKHLFENTWKSFAVANHVKDKDLSKALGELAQCGQKQTDERLKHLATIKKEAEELRKTYKAERKVTDYLDDILAETAVQTKALQTSDDEEGGTDPEALKKRVLAHLAQIKTRSPNDPPLTFMVCVAKPKSAVVFGRTVGAGHKKQLLAILPDAHGPTFYQGDCRWEESAYTFILDKVPSGLSRRLQSALLAETGAKQKVRVRSKDGLVVTDADEEAETPEGEEEGAEVLAPAAEWTKARSAVVEQLRALGKAIVLAEDLEARDAVALIGTIVKRFPPALDTPEAIAEVETYLATDEILTEAEAPNPFGTPVTIRALLMPALTRVKKARTPKVS